MKQLLLNPMKTEKLLFLKKSMTENSKNACWLLLSVILLTGTVTGITGPLESCVRQIAEQTNFMRKEIVLYRQFAEDQYRVQKQAKQKELLQKLREQVPDKIDPEEEVQMIYHLAGLHGITVQRLKRISDGSANSDKTGNKAGKFLWETEFYGTWQDLISFFSDIETQGPCTRMETLQIRKSGEKGKVTAFPGTGRGRELSVSGRICVYYCVKNTQRETQLSGRRKQASS
jgi:hypothetical protein